MKRHLTILSSHHDFPVASLFSCVHKKSKWLARLIIRIAVQPTSVEFLVHMSLAAGVSSINSLAEDGLSTSSNQQQQQQRLENKQQNQSVSLSRSEHVPRSTADIAIRHQRLDQTSVTGAQLDMQWRQLHHVEYLTDGGNSWIHTAVYDGRPIVVKTLKPECQDVVLAINEIEGELAVHSRLNHPNIVELVGAGTTSRGVRFVVLERLDGGTLTQMLGYDTRIRDRRRRFWKKKQFPFLDVLRVARSIALAMAYCHEDAIPGSVVLHRDLKPDNIGAYRQCPGGCCRWSYWLDFVLLHYVSVILTFVRLILQASH